HKSRVLARVHARERLVVAVLAGLGGALPIGCHGDLSVVLPPRRARDRLCDPCRGTGLLADDAGAVAHRLSSNWSPWRETYSETDRGSGSSFLPPGCGHSIDSRAAAAGKL